MNITYNASFYKSMADTLHERWIDNLKTYPLASSKEARSIYEDDIRSIYVVALKLIKDHRDHLNPIQVSQLHHILSRPLKDHLTTLKQGVVMH